MGQDAAAWPSVPAGERAGTEPESADGGDRGGERDEHWNGGRDFRCPSGGAMTVAMIKAFGLSSVALATIEGVTMRAVTSCV